MNKMDAMYFLEKFDAIPESKWITAHWGKGDLKCALGFCGEAIDIKGMPSRTEESVAFRKLLQRIGDRDGYRVNDGGNTLLDKNLDYHSRESFKNLGDTPKERVINALLLIEAKIL